MGSRSLGRLLVVGALVSAPTTAVAQTTRLVEPSIRERPVGAARVLAPWRERRHRRASVTTTAAMTALLGEPRSLPVGTEPALTAAGHLTATPRWRGAVGSRAAQARIPQLAQRLARRGPPGGAIGWSI